MSLFENPFSLEIPVRVGHLNAVFFINENLFVNSTECISAPHNHHDFEMRYIASGTCNQLIDQRVYTASASDLLLVHPLEYHCQTQDQINMGSSQYNLRFTLEPPSSDAPQTTLHAYRTAQQLLRELRWVHDRDGKLLICFRLLTNEIYERSSGFVSNIQGVCSCILTYVLRFSEGKTDGIFPAEELSFHGYGRSKIDEFFRHKYLTDVKIQDLANDMKVTPRQVNRVMHKMFGMSFTKKLTEMRLREVALQLTYTERSVMEISTDCGFHNYNYFFSCFRREFGVTPSQYRVQKREEA